MAHVLIAWELGHGLGHVTALRSIADELAAQGHRITVAGRDLVRTRRAFASSEARVLSAPFFPGATAPPAQMSSLADVLWYESGGHGDKAFDALFHGWRSLMGVLQPDLLIADAAQMALAAADGIAPAIDYVHGFHGTDAAAWGIFRDWERIDRPACERRAELLLERFNHARRGAALDAVDTLHCAFPAVRRLFRTLPELDHAGTREGVEYVGQFTHRGADPTWPETSASRRLFAYLRADHAHLERTIGALARLEDTAVLCFHDGIEERRLKSAPHIAWTRTPLDLARVMPAVDAVLCHGGGVHALAVQFGKPALVLPVHSEQFLSARAGERNGVSRMISPLSGPRPDVLSALRSLLSDQDMARRAQEIGTSQRTRVPDARAAVIDRIKAIDRA